MAKSRRRTRRRVHRRKHYGGSPPKNKNSIKERIKQAYATLRSRNKPAGTGPLQPHPTHLTLNKDGTRVERVLYNPKTDELYTIEGQRINM